MATRISPLAGKPAPPSLLVDVPRLLTAYYTEIPDPSVPAQRVAFGTSGHRGSAFDVSFNEWHVLAITQAICQYRKGQGIDGPLFLGIDTHALSQPAYASALEVLAANGIDVMLATHDEYTPTPAISHAILTHNRGRTSGLADGIVVTPSHNPPDNGGFKYNPPNGGPAGEDVTGWIEAAANVLLEHALDGVKRIGYARALRARRRRTATTISTPTSPTSAASSTWTRSATSKIRIGVDPLGGAGRALLGADRRALRARPDRRQRRGRSDVSLHDGRLGRPDPHGSVVALRDAAPARPQGPLRHRIRLRHRSRPPRHRHRAGRAAAAQPLPVGGDRLPFRAAAAMGDACRGRQDGRQHAHDRPGDRAARTQALRSSRRLQVVRRRSARRLARLRRRGKRRRELPAPRRRGLDHRQGRHRSGTARRPRSPRAAGATRARCTPSLPASSATRSTIGSRRRRRRSRRSSSRRSRRSGSRRPNSPARRSQASSATPRATARRSAASR